MYTSILRSIADKQWELQGYIGFRDAPTTTNMIEGCNSWLEDKLGHMDSFATLEQAKLWVNAVFLYRRTLKFTDAKGKFKFMNGTAPIHYTLKHSLKEPSFTDFVNLKL